VGQSLVTAFYKVGQSLVTAFYKVHNMYFYNQQKDSPEFAVFCGQVDRGINWQSSVDDVKRAYGQPAAEFSGTYLGVISKRLVFEGIDFRFENEKMVRIGIPGN
jgi:hypothetical protein